MSYANQSYQNNGSNAGNSTTSEADKRLDKKLFVGGLSWETTAADLKTYFSKYGKVEEASVKTDPNTGKPRGFGFVFFEESDSADKAVSERQHTLNGKNIDPKRAMVNGGKGLCRKIFVGGIDGNVEEATIRSYFSNYGKVEQVDLPYDKIRNLRRNFCFVTFESEEMCDAACSTMRQMIAGKEVDVKKATPAAAQAARARIQNTYGPAMPNAWGVNMAQWAGGMPYQPYNPQQSANFPAWNAAYAFGQGQNGQYDYNSYYGQQQGQSMTQASGQLWQNPQGLHFIVNVQCSREFDYFTFCGKVYPNANYNGNVGIPQAGVNGQSGQVMDQNDKDAYKQGKNLQSSQISYSNTNSNDFHPYRR
ncbi:Heterogeneous nuclear ribonucleoprotein D-like protein [Intoshia linei]|uniref:Heterogeneous nuclear ribonucleoprotein D-like protein n=1 Tax=Intoshia linei TaxID=1819745 RepID=A0A177AQT2_9BILA|nr:Heterogeneous nuclear ribonucleoprotein D-like protein [Intoshia linei]